MMSVNVRYKSSFLGSMSNVMSLEINSSCLLLMLDG